MNAFLALAVLFIGCTAAQQEGVNLDTPVVVEPVFVRPPSRHRRSASSEEGVDANPPVVIKPVFIKPTSRHRRAAVACPIKTALSPAQQTESVNIHNALRALETSSNELTMSGDSDLASNSQTWANNCQWMHGGLTGCGAWTGQTVGQNLYVENLSNGFPVLNMTKVVVSWNNERNDWNFATGTCATGKICGHWSQVAWALSTKVGCAYSQCSNMNVAGSVWQYALYVVCEYMTPGNVAGAPIMIPGPSCSNCDSAATGQGYKCVANLCQACAGPSTDSACKCGVAQVCQNGGTWNAGTCVCNCPKGWYGQNCQNSCTCADNDPDDCPYWASTGLCTDATYGPWMNADCMTSCNVPCVIPPNTPTCTSG